MEQTSISIGMSNDQGEKLPGLTALEVHHSAEPNTVVRQVKVTHKYSYKVFEDNGGDFNFVHLLGEESDLRSCPLRI